MTHRPIVIKDVVSQINNTRQVLFDEKSHMINQQFSFKRFRTEKDRIKELLSEKEQIESYNTKNLGKNKDTGFLQPTMRFKPRTDIERVVEAANKYSFGRISKEVVNQHLKKLELNSPKRSSATVTFIKLADSRPQSTNSKADSIDSLPPIDDSELKEKHKLYESPKKIREHLKQANQDARKMMDEKQVKTHFKAASNIGFNLDKVMNKPVRELMKEKEQVKFQHTSRNHHDICIESEESYDHRTKIEKLNKIPGKIKAEPNPSKEDMNFLKQLYTADHLLDPTELKKKKINFYSILKKQNRGSLIFNDPLLFFEHYQNNTLHDAPTQQPKSNIL
jgi:hypothetical protein